jgi:hypothetical protein
MGRKKSKTEQLDINEANKRLPSGWAAYAVAAALEIGYIPDDVLGVIIKHIAAGTFVVLGVGLSVRKRRGHETEGKRTEWWVTPKRD